MLLLLVKNQQNNFQYWEVKNAPKRYIALNLKVLCNLLLIKVMLLLFCSCFYSTTALRLYTIFIKICSLEINKSLYTALFVVSGSIKKLFSIDYVSICLFSIFFSFFSIDFTRWKNVRLPHTTYIVIH